MTKGIVFDIKRFAVHDGPGIRTTIFLKGCPLSCWWCHNPESRDGAPQKTSRHLTLDGNLFEKQEVTGYETDVNTLVCQAESDRIFFEESGGGVTLSGGEPLYQPEFCTELLQALKEKGIHTSLDTTGYTSDEIFNGAIPFTDLFLYDLKLMNEEEHVKYTGVSNSLILQNLKQLFHYGKEVIIRIPVIPGITDNEMNIQTIISFLQSNTGNQSHPDSAFPTMVHSKLTLPIKGGNTSCPPDIHLLPYHTVAKNKYRRFRMEEKMGETKPSQPQTLSALKISFEAAGFHVQIEG